METRNELITLRQAAKLLEVNPRTITRAVRKGLIAAKFGGLKKNRVVGVFTASIEALQKEINGGSLSHNTAVTSGAMGGAK